MKVGRRFYDTVCRIAAPTKPSHDMVISVNELPDGTAETAVADVSRQLEKLQQIAQDLGIPNVNSINWTLFVAANDAEKAKPINRRASNI